MPGARHKILGHVLSGFCHKMNRRKPLYGDSMDTPLNRCLTTLDITLLGEYLTLRLETHICFTLVLLLLSYLQITLSKKKCGTR